MSQPHENMSQPHVTWAHQKSCEFDKGIALTGMGASAAAAAAALAVVLCLATTVGHRRPPAQITGELVGVGPEVAHSVRQRHLPPPPAAAGAGPGAPLFDVVVVGGGAAGLAAAWRLAQAGPPGLRCAVLELDTAPGGNSLGGRDAETGLAFPWGAHYLPVPSRTGPTAAVAELLEAVLDGSRPPEQCDDQPWCQAQLYMPSTGRWEDLPERGGMLPVAALDAEGWRQYNRFMSTVDTLVSAVGGDGRPAFTLPVDESSSDRKFRQLDELSMVRRLCQHSRVSLVTAQY